MLKTIKITDKVKFKVDNNVGWAMIYRNQFGHDILPDLMPIMSTALEMAGGVLDKAKDFTDPRDLLMALDADAFEDAFIRLSGLEFTTFLNIAWAMAKHADNSIEEPYEWVKQFPNFPMDIVAPELVKVLFSGLVSTKNLKRLQEKIAELKPTNQ